MLTPRFALAWSLINLAGIACFLASAARFWTEPELAGIPGNNIGNAIGWFLFAVPIAGLFGLANLAWLLTALRREPWARWWRGLVFMLLVQGGWMVAWWVDAAHHGI